MPENEVFTQRDNSVNNDGVAQLEDISNEDLSAYVKAIESSIDYIKNIPLFPSDKKLTQEQYGVISSRMLWFNFAINEQSSLVHKSCIAASPNPIKWVKV